MLRRIATIFQFYPSRPAQAPESHAPRRRRDTTDQQGSSDQSGHHSLRCNLWMSAARVASKRASLPPATDSAV